MMGNIATRDCGTTFRHFADPPPPQQSALKDRSIRLKKIHHRNILAFTGLQDRYANARGTGRGGGLKTCGVLLFKESDRAIHRTLQEVWF